MKRIAEAHFDYKDEKIRYWIAGFLEGEGWFGLHQQKSNYTSLKTGITRNFTSPVEYVRAPQVEREPLNKLQYWLGGNISGRGYLGLWTLTGPRARTLMFKIYHLMSPKRKTQIRKALANVLEPCYVTEEIIQKALNRQET